MYLSSAIAKIWHNHNFFSFFRLVFISCFSIFVSGQRFYLLFTNLFIHLLLLFFIIHPETTTIIMINLLLPWHASINQQYPHNKSCHRKRGYI